ncbi:MAG TPA: hypothetical protein VGJ21_05365 [Terracidiphilus sp.]
MAASFAATHDLQDLAARFPGQIKVDDDEIRTIDKGLLIERPNEMDGFLPVVRNAEFANDAVLFEGLEDEPRVGRIVFCEKNRTAAARRSASLLRGA